MAERIKAITKGNRNKKTKENAAAKIFLRKLFERYFELSGSFKTEYLDTVSKVTAKPESTVEKIDIMHPR